MRNFKKILSLVLCMAMMLSVMVVGAGAAFKDQDKIQNTEAVDACAALNIINGYKDGTFKPEGTITRAEACKMICVALNGGKEPTLGTSATASFTDTKGHWAEGYIESCVAQGIVAGIGGGKFNPNGTVTGSQFAKMLLIALGYNADSQGYVGAAWEVNVNVDASAKGLYEDLAGMDPSVALTRDNAAQMVWNALNAYEVEYKYNLVTENGQLVSKLTVQDKVVGDNNDKITLLKDKYEVDKLEAVVVANEYGALDGSVQKEGKSSLVVTSINDKDVTKSATTYDVTTDMDQLGQTIVLFAKDTKTVVGAVSSSEENVVVTTNDSQTNKELVDLLDDADLKVDSDTLYSANYANAKAGSLGTNAAGVEFVAIDNNDDGIVEYVITVSYQFGEVTKYSTSDKGSLTVTTGNGKITYSDAEDVVGFENVAKEDYVIVTEIGGKLYINKAETVVGDLSAYKTNKSLTVDGTKYTVSGNAAVDYKVDTSEFKDANTYGANSTLDKQATFYLDNNGYVVAVGSVVGSSDDFAFVWGFEQGKFDGDYEVKVTLSDGTTGVYTLTDKAGSIGENLTAQTESNYVEKLFTYSINSSDEITLETIAQGKLDENLNNDKTSFSFSKNKATIAVDKNYYGDSDTVFFNVEYKNNKIDKVSVYTGIAAAPSIDTKTASIENILVSTTAGGTTAAAVVTFDASVSANGDYLYLYGYQGTNGDGAYYRAVLDGKLMNGENGNDYIYTDSNTQVADGVYEYTVTADGLYQIKDQPDNYAVGVITVKSGDSIIVNGVEYTVNASTQVATIDDDDTSVGDTLAKGDLVVLVYDVSGDDKVVTGAYIMEEVTGTKVATEIGALSGVTADQIKAQSILLFPFTATAQNYTLTVYDGADVVYTETTSSAMTAGDHNFYIDVMAASHNGSNEGTGTYAAADFDKGTYTFTVVGADGTVAALGSFEI